MGYHVTLTKMAETKTIRSVDKDREKLEPKNIL